MSLTEVRVGKLWGCAIRHVRGKQITQIYLAAMGVESRREKEASACSFRAAGLGIFGRPPAHVLDIVLA